MDDTALAAAIAAILADPVGRPLCNARTVGACETPTGLGRCGQPAQLYTCGWRCTPHAPGRAT